MDSQSQQRLMRAEGRVARGALTEGEAAALPAESP